MAESPSRNDELEIAHNQVIFKRKGLDEESENPGSKAGASVTGDYTVGRMSEDKLEATATPIW